MNDLEKLVRTARAAMNEFEERAQAEHAAMNELEERAQAAQAVMQALPEWALRNMYWQGAIDSPCTSATDIIRCAPVVFDVPK
jgi:hypothetical protein